MFYNKLQVLLCLGAQTQGWKSTSISIWVLGKFTNLLFKIIAFLSTVVQLICTLDVPHPGSALHKLHYKSCWHICTPCTQIGCKKKTMQDVSSKLHVIQISKYCWWTYGHVDDFLNNRKEFHKVFHYKAGSCSESVGTILETEVSWCLKRLSRKLLIYSYVKFWAPRVCKQE